MSEVVILNRSRETAELPTLLAIHGLLKTVHERPELGIGLIVGGPGMGKTTALESFRKGRNAVLCTMTPATATLTAGLAMIGESLGLNVSNRAAWVHREIVRHLKSKSWADERRPLILMIDESQEMRDELLQAVRHIWDQARVGFVLCGNPTFPERLRHGGGRFDQLQSRIGPRLSIPALEPGDLDAFCGFHNVTGPRACKLLADQAALGGGLRRLDRIVRVARGNSGHGAPITETQITAALQLLGYIR